MDPAGEHPASASNLYVPSLWESSADCVLGDLKMHGTNFWKDRQHSASRNAVSSPDLILGCLCCRHKAQAVFCSPGSLLPSKLVKAGVVAEGAEKAPLELSISSTFHTLGTQLCFRKLVSFCTMTHKMLLHRQVSSYTGDQGFRKLQGALRQQLPLVPVLTGAWYSPWIWEGARQIVLMKQVFWPDFPSLSFRCACST